MPYIESIVVTAAEAMTRGYCPECGARLASLDSRKHAVAHYGPDAIDKASRPEAHARQRMLSESARAKV